LSIGPAVLVDVRSHGVTAAEHGLLGEGLLRSPSGNPLPDDARDRAPEIVREGALRDRAHLPAGETLVLANVIALLLQTLAVRLGVVSGLDLAQASRALYPRPVRTGLWVLAQAAIVATDLTEVIGAAIALNMLFGLPLAVGAVITVADVLVILALEARGMRRLEAVVVALAVTVGACLAIERVLVGPDWRVAAGGLIPRLDGASLYVAIGIIGATIMPHNLYLHSALVKTRPIERSATGIRRVLRWFFFDTLAALNRALLVNAAILVVAAATFHGRGIEVSDLRAAHETLTPLAGTSAAALLFAVALLCAGQSSAITGTLAGQVVMAGFLGWQLKAWVVRLGTRGLSLLPALAAIAWAGDAGTLMLLVGSQIVLSLQLPFAVVPLLRATGDRRLMGAFATRRGWAALAWLAALGIIGLNVWFIAGVLGTAVLHPLVLGGALLLLGLLGVLLVAAARLPLDLPRRERGSPVPVIVRPQEHDS